MRIAICDDEPISLQITSSLVERWSAESGNPVEVFAFDNGDALLAKSSVLRMAPRLFRYYHATAQRHVYCQRTA